MEHASYLDLFNPIPSPSATPKSTHNLVYAQAQRPVVRYAHGQSIISFLLLDTPDMHAKTHASITFTCGTILLHVQTAVLLFLPYQRYTAALWHSRHSFTYHSTVKFYILGSFCLVLFHSILSILRPFRRATTCRIQYCLHWTPRKTGHILKEKSPCTKLQVGKLGT